MAKKYDFSGYVTACNVKCSDGRIIMKEAFKEEDGKRVPLVWNHRHDEPANVLGHCDLVYKNGDVWGNAVFNDTDSGINAKKLVQHGDIWGLSIYANNLKETNGRVMHGTIREVSLVLAGANPKAMIDSYISHSDSSEAYEDRSQGWIYSGREGELYHSEDEDDDTSLSHADEEDDDEDDSDDTDSESSGSGRTIGDVMDTFTDEQKVAVMVMLQEAIKNAKGGGDDNDSDEGETNVAKHNAFEQEYDGNEERNYLSHADEEKIINDAKNPRVGTLKNAIAAYCEDEGFQHGFDTQSLTLMFPEYKDLKPGAPEMLTDDQGWISKVLAKVHKSPMTRIRTRFTDIRDIENLRAKGYKKGERKTLTGDVSVLYRTTDAQTVYVRSDLHRDDILDITDFDVVQYMYNIDRMMLNEELATAILFGDGRGVEDQYKIHEDKIRPIWTDNELYTIHRTVDFDAIATELQGTNATANFGESFLYAETFVQELLYGREDAKNLGQGDLFIVPHALNKMLLARDLNGRRIYNTVEELRSALNVNSIITVEQMEGKTRTAGGKTYSLLGVVVDLKNYYLGCNKGGEITHFTDFDINFNVNQSLLETRCSGSNTRPMSALVLEEEVNPNSALTLAPLSGESEQYGVTVSDLQSNIKVANGKISGLLKYVDGTGWDAGTWGADDAAGNFFAFSVDAPENAVVTMQLLGGKYGAVTLDEDMTVTVRITNPEYQKIKLVSTVSGVKTTKIYTLTGLRLAEAE